MAQLPQVPMKPNPVQIGLIKIRLFKMWDIVFTGILKLDINLDLKKKKRCITALIVSTYLN